MIGSLYAAGARGRRRYYAARPHLRRRLDRPVISIGNIAAGGRAKTPLAALVATRLRAMGERPAILSRGYGRRDAPDGVVVVRDPDGLRADLDRAGDEPLMLARQLPGVAVLVSPSRYLAGRLAEHHFATTVHVLDDGFQHFDLHRDADLVAVTAEDVERPRTLPTGHLREPPDAAAAADAFVALDAASFAHLDSGTQPVWRASRRIDIAGSTGPQSAAIEPSLGPVAAIAGIAHPAAFFAALHGAGWTVVHQRAYRDHHRYTRDDVKGIFDTARLVNARAVVTTEKDLVRLLPFRPFRLPVVVARLDIELDDPASFDAWLQAIVRRHAADAGPPGGV